MATSSYTTVDWRLTPRKRDLLTKLHAIKNVFDTDSRAAIVVAEKGASLVTGQGDVPTMFKYRPVTIIRDLDGHQGDFTRWYIYVLQSLAARLSDDVQTKSRAMFYEVGIPEQGLASEKLKTITTAIALTANVHPYALGVQPEPKSTVYVPHQCKITLKIVKGGVNQWAEDKPNEESILEFGHGTHPIPPCILTCSIESTEPMRGVIVTEHRNQSTIFHQNEGPGSIPGLKSTLVVMTGGYADFASREFLSLLSRTQGIMNEPFLWVSDGDGSGHHIFCVLKYGCKSSAWASEYTICPQLLWASPTMDIYDAFVKGHSRRMMDSLKASAPETSIEKQRRYYKSVVENRDREVAIVKSQKPAANPNGKMTRLQTIESAGYLNTEPRLAIEVERLLAGGAPVSPSDFNRLEPQGMLILARDALCSVRNEVVSTAPVQQRMDSLRRAYLAASSQETQQAPTEEVQEAKGPVFSLAM